MVLRCRAEIPDPWVAVTGEQGPPLEFVVGPGTNVRAREVPNVARLEDENSSELTVSERLATSRKSVVTESIEVDALLPINGLYTGCRNTCLGKLSTIRHARHHPSCNRLY